jgi:hypothetical protein
MGGGIDGSKPVGQIKSAKRALCIADHEARKAGGRGDVQSQENLFALVHFLASQVYDENHKQLLTPKLKKDYMFLMSQYIKNKEAVMISNDENNKENLSSSKIELSELIFELWECGLIKVER